MENMHKKTEDLVRKKENYNLIVNEYQTELVLENTERTNLLRSFPLHICSTRIAHAPTVWMQIETFTPLWMCATLLGAAALYTYIERHIANPYVYFVQMFKL